MAKVDVTTLTTDQIESKLKAIKSVQFTIMAIFGVIVLAWIVLGLWRKNLPVFISTVAMSVAITAMFAAIRASYEQELRRRTTRST